MERGIREVITSLYCCSSNPPSHPETGASNLCVCGVALQTSNTSRPGKANQRKGQNEKFMNFAHFCVNSGVFSSLGKQAQQFTYGVVREGVIAENFPQYFRRISAPFPGAIKRSFRELSAEFPQTCRKTPFANDPIS